MEQKIKQITLIILGIISISSCTTLVLKYVGAFEKKPTVYELNNGDKQILFIPMHHVGVPSFYNGVKTLLDSLSKNGYSIMYEGASPNITDSAQLDIMVRKQRKLLGIAFSKLGYYDTVNKTLAGVLKYKGKKKITNQPKNYVIIDTLTAIKADVPINVILDKFENKYGPIVLDSTDMAVSVTAASGWDIYAEKKRRNIFIKEFVKGYRNEIIKNFLLNEKNNKIAIIYGKLHYNGVKKLLQQQDKNWK